MVPEKSLAPGTSHAFWAGSHKKECFTSKLCFLLLPQGLFKWQDHTSLLKWNSSQAELSSWAQPLTGWKMLLNAMKQTLAGSGKWFLCMKWTVQKEKKYSPFAVFSTTAGFSFCDCIFLLLLIKFAGNEHVPCSPPGGKSSCAARMKGSQDTAGGLGAAMCF